MIDWFQIIRTQERIVGWKIRRRLGCVGVAQNFVLGPILRVPRSVALRQIRCVLFISVLGDRPSLWLQSKDWCKKRDGTATGFRKSAGLRQWSWEPCKDDSGYIHNVPFLRLYSYLLIRRIHLAKPAPVKPMLERSPYRELGLPIGLLLYISPFISMQVCTLRKSVISGFMWYHSRFENTC